MEPIIIGCKTIEQELLTAMARQSCRWDVLWLESGLHNWPKKLNRRVLAMILFSDKSTRESDGD